ncbi:efflux RND transporter permease subunit [uncultured Shewanella sp.]|uniref:efflux RND transporter permease subunit n=1 Tax=uncultured Shewanella sp. TaxID=173975 RepID=UPI00261DF12D|nr:efflux RND transporter permease subunit [uncultured Shewanella sp.]
MIAYFARHPTIANLLMFTFIFLGIASVTQLKRETFPVFESPNITVTIVYPGASPKEVEESLCLRMEDAVDGLDNIEEVKCDAQEGVGTLTLDLNNGIDVGRMLIDVQTQINAVKDFPTSIEPPVVEESNWTDPVIDLAISANMSQPKLKDYAEDIKRRLKVDAGVGLVDIQGFSDRQLRIELNEIDMRRLGLTAEQVADKVSRQNIKVPAGTIDLKDKSILVRFDERKVTADELAKIVIQSTPNGGTIYLGDIATITDGFELEEDKIQFDGQPAAILKISKNKSEDALRVLDKVKGFVAQESTNLPDGVSLTLTNDTSSLIKDRLKMMVNNAWQGILLVFFSLLLFFSLRYSFWVAAGLPVAFFGGLYMMSLFGLSINMMSLVAFLVAIGIMMDDAIVIAESIAAQRDKGLSVDQSVIEGVKKVAPGVFSSYLTTICIFGSLLGLDGQMGTVLAVIPLVLIIILTVSLIEAFLILPNHLYHSLEKVGETDPSLKWKWKAAFLKRFESIKNNQLVDLVTFLVKWRYLTIGAMLSLFLLSIALVVGGAVKFSAFPELDGDVAEARIILPAGTSLAETNTLVNMIVAKAQKVGKALTIKNKEQENLVQNITAQYNLNADDGEKGAHVATIRLDIYSAEKRNTLIGQFINQWRSEVGEVAAPISMIFKQPAFGPAGRDIEIRLRGENLPEMKQASTYIQQYLNQFKGVTGVLDNLRLGKPEINIALGDAAQSYGIDGTDIANQLRSALLGQIADRVQVGTENIEIEVSLNRDQAGNISTLLNFPIMLADGTQIPLSAIAKLSFDRSYVRLQRIDGLPAITILGDVDNNVTNGKQVLAQFSQDLIPELNKAFPDVRVSLEGATKETAKTGKSFAIKFLIGIFGLFAILSFQFRSYIEPVIVMSAIPMALIGVIFGHLLLGYDLSMPSMMGFISLAGIVVNDSILLVEYIRHHVGQGEAVKEAAITASKERFRAIFLTSLTTTAGLLPLLLETSLQAQIVQPLVVSIVFGMLASTVLILLILPCAYAILADFGLIKAHQSLQEA